MPVFRFQVRAGSKINVDTTGTELPDLAAAEAHGRQIALELMRNAELKTRSWSLDVYDSQGQFLLEIPFVTVDATIEILPPEWKELIIQDCLRRSRLTAAFLDLQTTLRESRAILARLDQAPYLASDNGRIASA